MSQFRQALLDRIWHGLDPLAQVPTNLIQVDLQGWNSNHPYLERAVAEQAPAVIVEIGVWKGASTIFMADRMRAMGQSGVVIAVDTWLGSSEHWLTEQFRSQMSFMNGYPAMYHKFASNVLHVGVADYVIPLPLDSLNAAQLLARAGVRPGVIHLDGGHDYDSVVADLKVWWPLLQPGGLLVGDDYYTDGRWPTVKQAFDDFFAALDMPPPENAAGKCRIPKAEPAA
jgi:predicted O-methyltransferase YrrM